MRVPDDDLLVLNEPQRRAVDHGAGPLLVLAGPGSGKTRVVTHRIARLLERGIPGREILAVTFTNKAAREMRQRVRSLVGKRAEGLTVSTFHSACVKVLREEIGELEGSGYTRTFSIYDESSQQSLLRSVLRDLGGPGGGAPPTPGALLAGLTLVKNGRPPSAAVGPAAESAREATAAQHAFLEEAASRYQAELCARNAVDFDDLILLTIRLFTEHPAVLARWRERWRNVLVDEYQDTNGPQDRVLQLLTGEHRNLCVVGDDDQSIYGWRGADVEHVLHFNRRFPEAVVVRLEQNYRSTGSIVALANGIIANNPHRHPKTLFTEHGRGEPVRLLEMETDEEEADRVAGEIALEVRGAEDVWAASGRHAILLRTNEQGRPFEQALRRLRIPYRVLGGHSFFDRKEVQDILAYLRVAANPSDEDALHRIVNVPPRGLGAAALQALRRAGAERRVTTWQVLEDVADGAADAGLAPRVAEALGPLVRAVRVARRAGEGSSRTLVDDLLTAVEYDKEIERSYKDEGVRTARRNVAHEMQVAWEAYLGEATGPSLAGFLDSLALGDRDDERKDGGGVTLSTVHAAKGLEFPFAWVVGLEDGLFPHARSLEDGKALEEERRLFYVAVTRAGERLVLTRCLSRTMRGRTAKTQPSRFLLEAPDHLLERESDAPAPADAVAGHLARMKALLRPAD